MFHVLLPTYTFLSFDLHHVLAGEVPNSCPIVDPLICSSCGPPTKLVWCSCQFYYMHWSWYCWRWIVVRKWIVVSRCNCYQEVDCCQYVIVRKWIVVVDVPMYISWSRAPPQRSSSIPARGNPPHLCFPRMLLDWNLGILCHKRCQVLADRDAIVLPQRYIAPINWLVVPKKWSKKLKNDKKKLKNDQKSHWFMFWSM